MDTKFLLLPITVIATSLVLNVDKFQLSLIKAIAHTSLQAIFLYGLIFIFCRHRLIRFGIAVFVSIELFMQLSYGASLSLSVVMSIASASLNESVVFIKINLIPILLSLIFITGTVFLSFPSNLRMNRLGVICLMVGATYIIIPTLNSLKPLFHPKNYEAFYLAGAAKGQSESVTIGEVLIRNTSGRFPPLMSIIAISDAFHFMRIQRNMHSTWTNVTINETSPGLLVIGIGESLRADNMGIYHYERHTTPRLSSVKHQLNIYDPVYAAGTNTWSSISASLTKFTSPLDISKSIINLAKDAGYKTYWLSNHSKLATWDFAVSAIAQQSDYTYFTSKDQGGMSYDEVLLSKLNDVLVDSKNEEKRLVILHNYGSHTKFRDRYPPGFSVFQGEDKRLNEYDNSVLYTDHLQFEVLRIVSTYQGKYLFFADHGLVHPKKELRFKHDVRNNPDIDSLKVPFFTSKEGSLKILKDKPVSLFYFECIFSAWSGILSDELRENNYCKSALNKETITFLDASLKLHKKSLLASNSESSPLKLQPTK